MNERQTRSKYRSQEAVVAVSSGLIALVTGGVLVPFVGLTFSRDLMQRFLGKEGIESDSQQFDRDSRLAIKQATAKILAQKS